MSVNSDAFSFLLNLPPKMGGLSVKKKFLFFVGLPTLLAVLYFGLWATDMYVSEAQFLIRNSEGGGSSEILSFLGTTGGGSVISDGYVVREYIVSMNLLQILDQKLNLKEHFQSSGADFFSRLKADATSEDFLDYYRSLVNVSFDSTGGILTLKVRAFSPEMAQKLGQAILAESEKLVNRLRERALQDSLALARQELKNSEDRVTAAREALKKFRRKSDLLNPEATAGAMLSLIAELEGEAAKTRAELAEARAYLREDSAKIVALKARIKALEGQIKSEKKRLTGSDSRVLNELVSDYERLTVEREFGEKLYISALSSMEMARVRAESKSRYLVAFSEPSLPEESLYPKRFLSIGVIFTGASLLFGIVSLVIAAIREHAGF
ncbi:MAG: capsule biosynthesis protein [Deltaproteobacteria bacterium]|nr:capsule biosynthesis protein [Deltaproteobacteria bacterium]